MSAHCYDCGLAYDEEAGWVDVVLPDGLWQVISPTGDEGGLLCFTCIARRLVRIGRIGAPLKITSGPFLHEPFLRETTLPRVLSPGRGESPISMRRALKQIRELLEEVPVPPEGGESLEDRLNASIDDVDLMLEAIR